MKVAMCDMCGGRGAHIEIMVPQGDGWLELDLCSTKCVVRTIESVYGDQDESQDEDPQEDDRSGFVPLFDIDVSSELGALGIGEAAVEQERPLKAVPHRSPEESVENERQFRKQAERATSSITGVRKR